MRQANSTFLGFARTLALLGACLAGVPALGDSTAWREKVSPRVLDEAAAGPTETLVVLGEEADLSAAATISGKGARGRFVFDTLRATASRTQAPLRAWLDAGGIEHRPFWIANMVWVRGDLRTVEALARRADVRRIDANPRVRLIEPEAPPAEQAGRAPAAIEWNVVKIQADAVWSLGYFGQGVVIGGQDTGYEWDHPALLARYRGWNGAVADHAYNWHDAIHVSNASCPADSPVPCDDLNHGTHTMGTMVGDDGGANRVGVAPGAQWIGCRNMDEGFGTPATYAECFEWFIAPTDASGQNPDPAKAPHVINNSWACPPAEGCAFDTLESIVSATRAAGIVVVVSAGNSGSSCSTVSSPPAIYASSFSVGATSSMDLIAPFSSRGPVIIDGSGRMKPDVSAPGVSVRSSIRMGSYGYSSGTSMAGPHVAGMVALLLSARADLAGEVAVIEQLLRTSALPLTTTQTCGDVPGSLVPNHTYGWGRVDALNLLMADSDEDTRSNLDDCAPTNSAVWSSPGPVTDLTVSGGAVTQLAWSPPAALGAPSAAYELIRSDQADDFSSVTCLPGDDASLVRVDPEVPATAFHYLVRVKNDCGTNIGGASNGQPRQAATCP